MDRLENRKNFGALEEADEKEIDAFVAYIKGIEELTLPLRGRYIEAYDDIPTAIDLIREYPFLIGMIIKEFPDRKEEYMKDHIETILGWRTTEDEIESLLQDKKAEVYQKLSQIEKDSRSKQQRLPLKKEILKLVEEIILLDDRIQGENVRREANARLEAIGMYTKREYKRS
jgi:hypothetical protein